jgi:hypothetical protein
MIESYLRHVAATVAAVIIALDGDIFSTAGLKAMGAAALVAAMPPLLRWLNPHDEQFGRLVAPDHLEEH